MLGAEPLFLSGAAAGPAVAAAALACRLRAAAPVAGDRGADVLQRRRRRGAAAAGREDEREREAESEDRAEPMAQPLRDPHVMSPPGGTTCVPGRMPCRGADGGTRRRRPPGSAIGWPPRAGDPAVSPGMSGSRASGGPGRGIVRRMTLPVRAPTGAHARQGVVGPARGRWLAVRAQVGRLPCRRLPRRRRDLHPEPGPQAARPVLPGARGALPRAAPGAMRAGRRGGDRTRRAGSTSRRSSFGSTRPRPGCGCWRPSRRPRSWRGTSSRWTTKTFVACRRASAGRGSRSRWTAFGRRST